MTDHIDSGFVCRKCGHPLSWKDDLADDGVVTCTNCNTPAATLGELKASALQAAKEAVEKITGNGIKWD